MSITIERLSIPVGSSRMPVYLAGPTAKPSGTGQDAGRHPAVIVWMEIFGVNSHVRDVAGRLAKEGYVALAPNFFHRTAPNIEVGYDEKGMAAGMKELGALRADQMIADAQAAVAFLRERPEVRGDRIGCIGFCIGGHMAYLTAAETDVVAAVSFYGGGIAAEQGPGGQPSPIQRTHKIRGHILCLFGGKDTMIPSSQVEQIRAALREHSVEHEVIVYPAADHGFFCDQRATYHEPSAKDAWERAKQLFAKELKQ